MPERRRSTVSLTAMTSGLHHEHYKNDGRFQCTGKSLIISIC